MNETQKRNERRRQDMLANLTEVAERSTINRAARDPKNPEDLTSIQKDAALLVEFASRISDLPLNDSSEHPALKAEATKLVEHLDLRTFQEAIQELRVLFIALDQEAGMDEPGTKTIEMKPDAERVLEWLVRLDLHRALVEEKNLGSEFKDNREIWLALDEAFGFPIEFWSGFCHMRDA